MPRCQAAAVFAIFWAFGSAAEAGCENYTDGSMSSPAPRVRICYQDKCDETTLDYACANVSSAQFAYAVGWSVSAEIREDGRTDVAISWKGRPISPEKHKFLTCHQYEVDADACWQGAKAAEDEDGEGEIGELTLSGDWHEDATCSQSVEGRDDPWTIAQSQDGWTISRYEYGCRLFRPHFIDETVVEFAAECAIEEDSATEGKMRFDVQSYETIRATFPDSRSLMLHRCTLDASDDQKVSASDSAPTSDPSRTQLFEEKIDSAYSNFWTGMRVSGDGAEQTDVHIRGEGKGVNFNGILSINCESKSGASWKTSEIEAEEVVPGEVVIAARKSFCSAENSATNTLQLQQDLNLTAVEISDLISRVTRCWNIQQAPPEIADLRVRVQVTLNRDGTLAHSPKVLDAAETEYGRIWTGSRRECRSRVREVCSFCFTVS